MNDFLFRKEHSRRMPGNEMDGSIVKTHSPFSFQWIIILFFVFAIALSNQAYAQTVTLDLKDASIIRATAEISKQTKYDFTYNDLILKKQNRLP
ncbi:hypothetical protein [Pedobacter sp. P26]|uniref:hypothetical protein n=1 Tax=Pedobacter sp. P26 TaxID=3423956 RepID=UPI003D67A72A